MDTLMKLTLYGENAQAAAEPAKERIRELEGLLSTTDENSEIYAANHSGGAPVALSGDTAALLDRALQLCRRTDGALDVTIYPVVRAWGFTTGGSRVPDRAELDGLLERVDYARVALSGSTLTLPEGMELDLGAVAKGYTGDVLMDLLEEEGVTSAIVELGGNVQALGSKPDGSPWRVAVQAPEGGYAAALEIVDKAVVTSGGYQRFFEQDGEIYWHIIDPAAGQPARSGLASVTVVAEEGTLCDGLSTALFVMGADRAAEFWRETGDFDFVLLDEEGGVTITEGLEDSFSLCGEWAGRPLEVLRR
ncbi:MAG: FAD:protein FMN transferase [Oscillospiraceae bacterium]|nr:FAD:protein FMN transferase [Oscillospiraceae bacterium]